MILVEPDICVCLWFPRPFDRGLLTDDRSRKLRSQASKVEKLITRVELGEKDIGLLREQLKERGSSRSKEVHDLAEHVGTADEEKSAMWNTVTAELSGAAAGDS